MAGDVEGQRYLDTDHLGYIFQAKTNALAAALYEKEHISSPQSSVSELPMRLKDNLAKRYSGAKHFPYEDYSVCRHSRGIITAGRNPIFLSSDKERLYGFIAKRVEQVFGQNARSWNSYSVCRWQT